VGVRPLTGGIPLSAFPHYYKTTPELLDLRPVAQEFFCQ